MSFAERALHIYIYIYGKMPAAERRNIILPADRAEIHLDVYFYFFHPRAPDFHREGGTEGETTRKYEG